ncbi:hypothetical protein, partial [Rhodococcoides fascians]|uniref:hypothetical protein n=1 Tax=Rhodococcoides fascians TaxID=1828 RepID=UPI00197DC960
GEVGSSPRTRRTGTIVPRRRWGALDRARRATGLRKACRIEESWNDSSTSPEGEVLLSNR